MCFYMACKCYVERKKNSHYYSLGQFMQNKWLGSFALSNIYQESTHFLSILHDRFIKLTFEHYRNRTIFNRCKKNKANKIERKDTYLKLYNMSLSIDLSNSFYSFLDVGYGQSIFDILERGINRFNDIITSIYPRVLYQSSICYARLNLPFLSGFSMS